MQKISALAVSTTALTFSAFGSVANADASPWCIYDTKAPEKAPYETQEFDVGEKLGTIEKVLRERGFVQRNILRARWGSYCEGTEHWKSALYVEEWSKVENNGLARREIKYLGSFGAFTYYGECKDGLKGYMQVSERVCISSNLENKIGSDDAENAR